ncbi:pyridoxal phosphate-dependent decarboxylase family protein [Pseudooceanicola nanhaiensis]|uniref:pyridoxal phosphate-dependent decarboxylase family protein n=1 Tax=Pseudooceanicola nanhaiensis TaxID=375761 RepID=UPI001CD7B415|nr:pyridoxal-dependent decarboxylase [Pseudooceanicola nanhaiensis]MCA0922303.1 aspartate aminotransferase family protein [Pseudooceanicola nanhaiensis]
MRWTDFPKWGRWMADWAAGYHAGLRDRPVRARSTPGAVLAALPAHAPEAPEPMEQVIADFESLVVPGITHWQHPRFFAYFPSNASPAAVLADTLIAAMSPQCMLWQTSPAATEMETRMMEWLRDAIALPGDFHGVIQDSASTATLAAVLVMRERALDWAGNQQGLGAHAPVRIYCSGEVHTSVDRAIWVAGIGSDNLRRIPTQGPTRAMDPAALRAAIAEDRAAGLIPAGIIGSTGGTSTGGSDDIAALADIAEAEGLFLHVDAAWAGSAMICEEFRPLWAGVERADSVVFNPHKWLGVQFDCSAHFIRSPEDLTRTLAYRPEFLKTHGADGIINYSEWSVPLGRRFRALKLWFLLRAYGLEALRGMIRNHVTWSQALCEGLRGEPDFTIVTEPVLSLFTFRYTPEGAGDLDALNQRLVQAINDDGRIYLTQTQVADGIALRFQAGQWDCTEADVILAGEVIREIARGL